MKKTIGLVLLAGAAMLLAGCDQPGTSDTGSGSTGGSASIDIGDYEYADGILDYQGADVETKSEILAAMEKYAMDSHLAGIPIYDDAGYTLYSPRLTLPTDKYIPNYGYGSGEGTIDANGPMANGKTAAENGVLYPTYYQGYALDDSGTFNAWDSQGEDVTGKSGMVSASYFGVAMNETKDNFYWRNDLSKDERPIMLDENGNEVAYTEGATSRFWRVHLSTGEDDGNGVQYCYALSEKSPYYAEFNGRPIRLEDYLTPFKVMLDAGLTRAANLVQDSSGFAGAYDYFYSTADKRDWSQVGIQINEAEGSLDFEFVTPQTQFYAMYNLASSLYAPVPAEFIYRVGGGTNDLPDDTSLDVTQEEAASLDPRWNSIITSGGSNFGRIQSGTPEQAVANIISTGPYVVDSWEQNKLCVYSKNDTYFRASDYHYEGYVETVFQDNEENAWKAWVAGKLDDMTVPSTYINEAKPGGTYNSMAYPTEGTTTIKLNVNSCTQEEWNYYFGPNGSMVQNRTWQVKPIMSNDNFLDGVFFAIDRKAMADELGRNPALGYLSSAYKIDPENDLSYRDTPQAEAVLDPYVNATPDNDYAYDQGLAAQLFALAIEEEVAAGNYENGDVIRLTAKWRYQRTIDDIGSYLKNYIETAWDEACEITGYDIDLIIDNVVAGSSYNDCYTAMNNGEYDFAEGAITGNVLNPIEFMSVVCTNSRAQGFNTNWGERTDVVSEENPILFDGKIWSFDALYVAANGAAIVRRGVNIDPVNVEESYGETRDENTRFRFSLPGLVDDEGAPLIHYDINYFWLLGSIGGGMSMYYADATSLLYLEGSSNPDLAPNEGQAAFTATLSDRWLTITCETAWLQAQMDGLQQAGEVFDGIQIMIYIEASYSGISKGQSVLKTIPYENIGLVSGGK